MEEPESLYHVCHNPRSQQLWEIQNVPKINPNISKRECEGKSDILVVGKRKETKQKIHVVGSYDLVELDCEEAGKLSYLLSRDAVWKIVLWIT